MISKRDAKDNPYFRDCHDEELQFRIEGIEAHTDVTLDRMNRRTSLLDQFDTARRELEQSRRVTEFGLVRERAMELLFPGRAGRCRYPWRGCVRPFGQGCCLPGRGPRDSRGSGCDDFPRAWDLAGSQHSRCSGTSGPGPGYRPPARISVRLIPAERPRREVHGPATG